MPLSIACGGVTSANGVRSPFLICCQKPLPDLVLSIVLLPLGSAYPIAFLNCFPKDVSAFITFAKENNIDLNTIEGGWKTNLEVRPEKDWEQDKGRAVSE